MPGAHPPGDAGVPIAQERPRLRDVPSALGPIDATIATIACTPRGVGRQTRGGMSQRDHGGG
eukprot:363455-Chlamydomonas_euryale.AAC.7